MERTYENDIAVIGMSGRFPKAKNIDAFWKNLSEGISSVSPADPARILASGISKEVLNHQRFVNASSKLEDAKYFDANFFGLSNTEATLMDPQIRLLLQASWHALEDAGYALNELDASVGNFCGMSINSYLMNVIKTNAQTEAFDPLLYRILNEKDFLATWISYKLNLTGPAMTVQTACSTSLLAAHLACQSLLNHECSMALVGGVSYDSDDSIGYIHIPESIYSKDGICRPFDKDASGTLMGDGVGTLVLKRAEDAIKDKDQIYALIRGTASNNDGADKQGYTTPSVNYQRDVILEALAVSDIDPSTIGMIEAHGTGTLIGDPIEVAALTEAFREYTEDKQYCAIGSVKSNIGHLDAAAGIASMIKAILCVNQGVLVPSINFSTPNPSLQLDTSPFYVSTSHQPWPEQFEWRRAGITSLGVGGTNVHVIVEEPPELVQTISTPKPSVVQLSAMNAESLEAQKEQWIAYLEANPAVSLQDVAFTSVYGRKLMSHRFSVVCESREELLNQLKGAQKEKCYEGSGDAVESVFLFPGQGSQYPKMAMDLYESKEAFREDMDTCFTYIRSKYELDFKSIINAADAEKLNQTEYTQLALFIVEYCLAKELIRSGIQPKAMVGHSLGEYVAACLVGCLSLEDTLDLVYHRGRLMGSMPEGDMILVRTTEEVMRPLLLDTISVCAFNAPGNLVVGGHKEAVQKQIEIFENNSIQYRKLKVSHAYHTPMMEAARKQYEAILATVTFNDFDGNVFSTHTGKLVNAEEFTSPQYWLDQIINPVKFSDAVAAVAEQLSNPIFVEVGPGNGLSYFIKKIFDRQLSCVGVLPKASSTSSAVNSFYEAKALLGAKGLAFLTPEKPQGRRVSLPGYVFSKTYFWKPQKSIRYENFESVSQSFHYTEDRYQSNRLRTSVEIPINNKTELSEEVLNHLQDLHAEYLKGVEALFAANGRKVQNLIEVLYDDQAPAQAADTPSSASAEQQRVVSSVFVEPSTEAEKTVATYWGDLLGYQPVGVLDNYFEVGGNSLLATQLINKIMKELEVELTITEILTHSTVKDLAGLVEEKKWLKSDQQPSNELII